MAEIKLSTDELRYMSVFERITGVTAKDCIVDGERIIFVVSGGDMGLAIGRGGENVEKVRNTIGKKVEVVEYSDDVEEFVKNLLRPIAVRNVRVGKSKGKQTIYIEVHSKDKGLAIGKGGRNIKKMKLLVQRHYGIDGVVIE
ncbi:NusA-like transcription termination signal-binding factor [Methanosarcinales archaeon]|nr:MAG: NusA-like transcription termination signal-binding factor [Methanosarcinales archaeon]